jgi:hypothetical protein
VLDHTTKLWMEKLRERREQLSEVDTVNPPDIAAVAQASLRKEIEDLEGLLHAKVRDLDGIIQVGEHRMTFSYRMDREDILRVLGYDIPEPERDTPKLNALMNPVHSVFADDPITVAESFHREQALSLETMLLLGHDKGVQQWVDNLTPVQLAIVRVMLPRLHQMIEGAYAKLPHMEYPEIISKPRPWVDSVRIQEKPWLTDEPQDLADREPGSFDD